MAQFRYGDMVITKKKNQLSQEELMNVKQVAYSLGYGNIALDDQNRIKIGGTNTLGNYYEDKVDYFTLLSTAIKFNKKVSNYERRLKEVGVENIRQWGTASDYLIMNSDYNEKGLSNIYNELSYHFKKNKEGKIPIREAIKNQIENMEQLYHGYDQDFIEKLLPMLDMKKGDFIHEKGSKKGQFKSRKMKIEFLKSISGKVLDEFDSYIEQFYGYLYENVEFDRGKQSLKQLMEEEEFKNEKEAYFNDFLVDRVTQKIASTDSKEKKQLASLDATLERLKEKGASMDVYRTRKKKKRK